METTEHLSQLYGTMRANFPRANRVSANLVCGQKQLVYYTKRGQTNIDSLQKCQTHKQFVEFELKSKLLLNLNAAAGGLKFNDIDGEVPQSNG